MILSNFNICEPNLPRHAFDLDSESSLISISPTPGPIDARKRTRRLGEKLINSSGGSTPQVRPHPREDMLILLVSQQVGVIWHPRYPAEVVLEI